MAAVLRTLALLGATIGLAACGSNSSGHSSSGKTQKVTAASASGGKLASRPPSQIISAAQAALRSASSFVVAGTLHQNGQLVRVRIVEAGPEGLSVQFSQSTNSGAIIALPAAAYVRANQAFWSAQLGVKAASLAGRWIQLPANASAQLTSGFGPLAPGTLAQCLGEDLGTLSHAGSTTVNGQPAVVVRQAADKPGSTAGTIAIAASGPPYPLRLTGEGRTRPGGKIDVCNPGKGGSTTGVLTLTDFNHAPPITAPKHATKPGSGSGSSV